MIRWVARVVLEKIPAADLSERIEGPTGATA
jgi:hypothetical protein